MRFIKILLFVFKYIHYLIVLSLYRLTKHINRIKHVFLRPIYKLNSFNIKNPVFWLSDKKQFLYFWLDHRNNQIVTIRNDALFLIVNSIGRTRFNRVCGTTDDWQTTSKICSYDWKPDQKLIPIAINTPRNLPSIKGFLDNLIFFILPSHPSIYTASEWPISNKMESGNYA